jgi:ferredoxin
MPRVSLEGTDKVFEITEGEILYDALYDQGCELPHGCLSGSCGACRVEILTGKDNLSAASLVEQNTVNSVREEFVQVHGARYVENKTIRLSCRAKVIGDVSFKPMK